MKLFNTSEPHPSAYLEGVEYRGFKIVQTREHFLYEIQSLGDSPIPHKLTGKYTNISLLKDTIDTYINKNNDFKDTDTSR